MSDITRGFAGAVVLMSQGQAVTRKGWNRSRILLKNGQLMIQHDVSQPGVTPWLFTKEDRDAHDYVPAYFNHRDTTVPIQ